MSTTVYYVYCLGTHDIQNISVTSPHPSEIRVTGNFIDGSTATGVLVVDLIPTATCELCYHYHLIQRNGEVTQVEGRITDVVGGEHSISVFVVENNGLPFNRTASTPQIVFIRDGNHNNLC